MKFHDAAARQYRRTSYYTVYLVKPDGTRVELGYTPRKTGQGLLALVYSAAGQATIKIHVPDMNTVEITRRGPGGLDLSNGCRIEFGGTIRQEATE
jgi:hypothetical protein